MQIVDSKGHIPRKAAVWNNKTYKLIWSPSNAIDISWLDTGTKILFIQEHYQHRPELHKMILSRLQSESRYYLCLCTWPDLSEVHKSEISFPTGWPMELVVSQSGTVGLFTWNEQDCAGYEVVSLKDNAISQQKGLGKKRSPNLLTRPAISPTEEFIVSSWGKWNWWGDKPEEPSLGGTFESGIVVIHEIETNKTRQIPVTTTVPSGWEPDPFDKTGFFGVGNPRFLTDHNAVIELPFGQEMTIDVYAYS
jgi:hypothetical protein